MKKYWHIYFLFIGWALFDGIYLKYGPHTMLNSFWHICVLIFIFESIRKELLTKSKAINISLFTFLFVISIKILLNLVAAFSETWEEYNSVVNNSFVDFGCIVVVLVVHVYTGFKWRQ